MNEWTCINICYFLISISYYISLLARESRLISIDIIFHYLFPYRLDAGCENDIDNLLFYDLHWIYSYFIFTISNRSNYAFIYIPRWSIGCFGLNIYSHRQLVIKSPFIEYLLWFWLDLLLALTLNGVLILKCMNLNIDFHYLLFERFGIIHIGIVTLFDVAIFTTAYLAVYYLSFNHSWFITSMSADQIIQYFYLLSFINIFESYVNISSIHYWIFIIIHIH